MSRMKRTAIRPQRADANSYRLLRNGVVVGLALEMTNGRWRVCDGEGNALINATFDSILDAARAMGSVARD